MPSALAVTKQMLRAHVANGTGHQTLVQKDGKTAAEPSSLLRRFNEWRANDTTKALYRTQRQNFVETLTTHFGKAYGQESAQRAIKKLLAERGKPIVGNAATSKDIGQLNAAEALHLRDLVKAERKAIIQGNEARIAKALGNKPDPLKEAALRLALAPPTPSRPDGRGGGI